MSTATLQSPKPARSATTPYVIPHTHNWINSFVESPPASYQCESTSLLSHTSADLDDFDTVDHTSSSCCPAWLRNWCEMSGLLCCFGCLTLFGCRDRVCQKLVFFPPSPMYSIEDAKEGSQVMYILDQHGKKIEPYSDKNFRCEFVKTRRKQTVATMWIAYPRATTTILFSHGNATDLGCMRDHLLDLSYQLKVNIMAYDYSGYGLSTGSPSMANTLADIERVYDLLVDRYPDRCERIIAYGQSLGSGPTLHLTKVRPLSGVVIHSGLMSGLRVIRNVKSTSWFDIYPNVDIVKTVQCPLFVIHGVEDEEIPIHHGQGIAENAKNAFKPFFVEGAGHNNIEVQFREEYIKELYTFIRYINSQAALPNGTQSAPDSPDNHSIHLASSSSVSSPPSSATPKSHKSKHKHGHPRAERADSAEQFDLTV